MHIKLSWTTVIVVDVVATDKGRLSKVQWRHLGSNNTWKMDPVEWRELVEMGRLTNGYKFGIF